MLAWCTASKMKFSSLTSKPSIYAIFCYSALFSSDMSRVFDIDSFFTEYKSKHSHPFGSRTFHFYKPVCKSWIQLETDIRWPLIERPSNLINVLYECIPSIEWFQNWEIKTEIHYYIYNRESDNDHWLISFLQSHNRNACVRLCDCEKQIFIRKKDDYEIYNHSFAHP